MRKASLYIILFFLAGNVFGQQSQFDSVYVHNPDSLDGLVSVRWKINSGAAWDSILVYRKTNTDTSFVFRGKVEHDSTEYIDNSLCGVNVVYALSLYQDGSSIDSTTLESVFENDVAPFATLLYSLNYDNGSIALNWEKTEDLTATGYSIISYENSFDTIAHIYDPERTTYTLEEDVFPCSKQDQLLMITRDLCASSPNVTENYLQSLTLIENLSNDTCDRSVTINFSEYIPADGLNQRILEHEIWASENDSVSVLVGTLEADTSQYVHENITSGSKYEYTIKTFLEIGGDTVSSVCCPDSILTKEIPLPGFFEIEYVTVTDDNLVELKVRADTVSINGYAVYRNAAGEMPQLLVQLNPQAQETWTFTDSTANPEIESYFYDVKVIDECSTEAMDADTTSRSIHLSVETENNTNFLEWNAYEGWEVENYVIYRFGVGYDTTIVTTVSDGTFTLTDTPAVNPAEGQWQYYVVAISAEGNKESYSNVASANHNTIFKVPTAFRPGGETYIFKPFFVSLPPQGYQFLIYNRWGQLIFETTDHDHGWDGTFNGEPAPMGSYIYIIRYQDNNNQPNQEKGTVVLIR